MTVPEQIKLANDKVMDIFLNARPVWTDVRPAIEVVPGMTANTVLIPGPPIAAENLPIPLRTAVSGAAVHEGLDTQLGEALAAYEALHADATVEGIVTDGIDAVGEGQRG